MVAPVHFTKIKMCSLHFRFAAKIRLAELNRQEKKINRIQQKIHEYKRQENNLFDDAMALKSEQANNRDIFIVIGDAIDKISQIQVGWSNLIMFLSVLNTKISVDFGKDMVEFYRKALDVLEEGNEDKHLLKMLTGDFQEVLKTAQEVEEISNLYVSNFKERVFPGLLLLPKFIGESKHSQVQMMSVLKQNAQDAVEVSDAVIKQRIASNLQAISDEKAALNEKIAKLQQ